MSIQQVKKQSSDEIANVKSALEKLLSLSTIDSVESVLSIRYDIFEHIIKFYEPVVNSICIESTVWNGITNFFQLMIYFNTDHSIKLAYLMYEQGYHLTTKYYIKGKDGQQIEMDILAAYLCENPPASYTPYRQDVINLLDKLNSDRHNDNYRNTSPKTVLELYKSGILYIK